MSSSVNRIIRFLLWIVLTVLLLLAGTVTALRVGLPQLNRIQPHIESWISRGTGIHVSIGEVSGFWRNTHPSVSLKEVKVTIPDNVDIQFQVDNLELEFDLLETVRQGQLVLADMVMNKMLLDVHQVDLTANSSDDSTQDAKADQRTKKFVEKLDNLLLSQLDRFSLADSQIIYKPISGESTRTLDIENLQWRNEGRRHLAQGSIFIEDVNLNELEIRADFVDKGSLLDVTGNFYLSIDQLSIDTWIPTQYKQSTGIKGGSVSLNTWITLENSLPTEAYLELDSSYMDWQRDGVEHELTVDSALLHLKPLAKGWQIDAHDIRARTNDSDWPLFDIASKWQSPEQWQINVSQLNLESLRPLTTLGNDQRFSEWLNTVALDGQISDLRLAATQGLDSLRYSAQINRMAMKQWNLLPGFSNVAGSLRGNLNSASATVSVIDDKFPYGEVFQAPLNIKQGLVDIHWQNHGDKGWSLWSDKVTAATPDLQVLGAFRLDFPVDDSPFLSFYGEADLYNAGETWRYLPALALGRDLTDYLSSAIQAGKVNTAKLLWYGRLADFPYQDNNGIFQAWVGLKEAKFSFDTNWPPLTDLQLDLLFQNESMFLDSKSATLLKVKGRRITGRIPSLSSDGHLEIEAVASGNGDAVRDYMTATPLVDSVGAALTAVQVSGNVDANFQLYIPFADDTASSRAWGYATLKNNHIEIETPPMALEKVSGRIEFDNDVVKANGLSANLLGQPINLDFKGQNASKGYSVVIDTIGDWDVLPLQPYVGERFIGKLTGRSPWHLNVDLQLNDVGFTYQLDLEANLATIASDYPVPLNKKFGDAGIAKLQASGNQQSISARLQLPAMKYQTEIDISTATPELKATNLVIGEGGFKISPIVGHHFQVRAKEFDADQWVRAFERPKGAQEAVLDTMNTPTIPMPQRINIETSELTLGGVLWHDVNFSARYRRDGWLFELDSQEAEGEASYSDQNQLHVALERLHIFIPDLEQDQDNQKSLLEQSQSKELVISDFDRNLFAKMPDTHLTIDDLWLQGYKVGTVNMSLARRQGKLVWDKFDIVSGSNQISAKGSWLLTKATSQSEVVLNVKGDNNSDLMARFGISSGIQKANFEINSKVKWDGAPWSVKVDTINGEIDTKLGKGIISDVSGAARLLGLFSIDSIIRKMQLDFTDVFDKGMAFKSITGSGTIENGVFITNDIEMDATAGKMKIIGLADLNTRMVDAQVNFKPDLTSGIPIISAFAVTPQTALVILAVTTMISPVVEVVTQVNYEVKGPLDSPIVKEISRTKGEYKLPAHIGKEDK